MIFKSLTSLLGDKGEKIALKYLLKQNLKLIERNFSCRVGEIDLIMQHQDFICFIEVKLRTSKNFGGALQSITLQKRAKIIKTAKFYLSKNNLLDLMPVRFDVVLLEGRDYRLEWIQNAFY